MNLAVNFDEEIFQKNGIEQPQKLFKKIPAILNLFTNRPKAVAKKRKVAVYVRISTDNEEQLSSYVKHRLISRRNT